MTYSVEFTLQAEGDLVRLDKTIAQHIADKIDWLSQNIELEVYLKSDYSSAVIIGFYQCLYSFI